MIPNPKHDETIGSELVPMSIAPRVRRFTNVQAKRIGDRIGVNWKRIPLSEFRRGLVVELEHGRVDRQTDITHDNLLMTGKIALAHLKEHPRYYTRLRKVESLASRGGKRESRSLASRGGKRESRSLASRGGKRESRSLASRGGKRVERDHISKEPFDSSFTPADLRRFAADRKAPTDPRFYVFLDRYGSDKRGFYVATWYNRNTRTWRSERLHRDYHEAMDWAWLKRRVLHEKLYGHSHVPLERSYTVIARF